MIENVLLLCLLASAPDQGRTQEWTQEWTLADPGQSASLTFRAPYARLEVVGGDHGRIILTVSGPNDLHLPLVMNGNHAEVVFPDNDAVIDVRIEVPRNIDLTLETGNAGRVRVSDVIGYLEVVNSNDGVELHRVGGAIAVTTSNGGIQADITELFDEASVSLITSNGPIEVHLPASFSGRVFAVSDTGPIESEFQIVPDSPPGLRPPGRVLHGHVGDGEARLRLQTDNAGIRLIRSAPRP